MKATIAHTSEGRTKVVLHDVSQNIEQFFENLGGKKTQAGWIFSRADGKHVPSALAQEGYSFETHQLI